MGSNVWPLARLSLVVVEDAIVGGGGVGLSPLVFFVLGDDDGAGVSPNVDDIAEVIVGVVVRLSIVLLDVFKDALAAFSAPLVANPSPILLVAIVFFFHLDGDLETWRGR